MVEQQPITFRKLDAMDTFIIGLRGLRYAKRTALSFDLTYDDDQEEQPLNPLSEVIPGVFLPLNPEVQAITQRNTQTRNPMATVESVDGSTFGILYLSFSGFERRSNFLCSQCEDSPIIFERFCISSCPSNYVP